jgi:hypothetical protein
MFGEDTNQNQWQQPQGGQFSQAPGTPEPATPNSDGTIPAPSFDNATAPITNPTDDNPLTSTQPAAPADETPILPATGTVSNDDLLQIKQNALQELSPLVNHLEQSPEEKFRTTMMMIQASDDHTLLQVAYDTAKQITDEKIRAQALLDVINEINYFTQQHHQS